MTKQLRVVNGFYEYVDVPGDPDPVEETEEDEPTEIDPPLNWINRFKAVEEDLPVVLETMAPVMVEPVQEPKQRKPRTVKKPVRKRKPVAKRTANAGA